MPEQAEALDRPLAFLLLVDSGNEVDVVILPHGDENHEHNETRHIIRVFPGIRAGRHEGAVSWAGIVPGQEDGGQEMKPDSCLPIFLSLIFLSALSPACGR